MVITDGGVGGICSNDDSSLLLPSLESQPTEALDCELVLHAHDDGAQWLKINEKLTIALVDFDFGGQRMFGAVLGLFMNKYGLNLVCSSMV